ncbi:MAG: carbohydrate ABC transporter permease, partial [Actinobacteria bacterium]|nr:carbohydrate ABC transporter permease [Actinomycetota bacterium]
MKKSRLLLYPALIFFLIFFLLPVYVVLVTSLKPLGDISLDT